jgi:pimeloyl-ACP methyl ester carboxylesterase
MALVVSSLFLSSAASADTSTQQSSMAREPMFALPPFWIGICHEVTFPVTLTDNTHADLRGFQCIPTLRLPPRTDLLLLHGGTYNSSYWSWPDDPAVRSTVWSALAAGYAVTAIDRLGYGISSHPLSGLNTFTQQGWTLHQVVAQLKVRYTSVVGVGHSFGSAQLVNQAATYPQDYAALVVTGSGSKVSAATTAATHTAFSAAATVWPRRFSPLDPGYLTNTTAAGRLLTVYTPGFASPGMVQFDWTTEDTLTLGEITSRPATLNALTATIRVPVLLLDGQHDAHYCDNSQAPAPNETNLDDCSSGAALYTAEKPNYLAACFTAGVVPRSGHDLTTEEGAATANRDIVSWVRETISPTTGHARCAQTGALSIGR